MIASVVLLAGYSSRMGQPKQHVKLNEKTFLERINSTLLECKSQIFPQNMFFVGQKADLKSEKYVLKNNANWLINPTPEEGPLSSIRIAIKEFSGHGGFILWPIDHPMVSTDTVKLLIDSFLENPDKIVIPSIDNRRGHPVIFPAWSCPHFFEIPLEYGAKTILQKFPDKILHICVNDSWIRKNINTPEILSEAQSWLSSSQNS
jgi:molybdenum cofactor cytidylyltransferase